MIIYEVTIACDGHDCKQVIVGDDDDAPGAARASAKQEAVRENWSFANGKHLCQECALKEGVEP